MIIINLSSEAILRNTFASVELKNVRGLPAKLIQLRLTNAEFFID